jgi:hypothetical protein
MDKDGYYGDRYNQNDYNNKSINNSTDIIMKLIIIMLWHYLLVLQL